MSEMLDNLKLYIGTRNGSFVVFAVLGVFLLFLATVTRLFFENLPTMGNRWFYLTNFQNFDFAFSLPIPGVMIYIIYAVILAFIFVHLYNHRANLFTYEKFAWLCILSGAFSNIFERVRYGYVLDYFGIFTGIFNLADIYILIGILILIKGDRKKEASS